MCCGIEPVSLLEPFSRLVTRASPRRRGGAVLSKASFPTAHTIVPGPVREDTLFWVWAPSTTP